MKTTVFILQYNNCDQIWADFSRDGKKQISNIWQTSHASYKLLEHVSEMFVVILNLLSNTPALLSVLFWEITKLLFICFTEIHSPLPGVHCFGSVEIGVPIEYVLSNLLTFETLAVGLLLLQVPPSGNNISFLK